MIYLIDLCLGRLLQCVEGHVHVFLELGSHSQCNVAEYGQDLRLHGSVHRVVLQHNKMRSL